MSMMIHRHFEGEQDKNVTKLKGVSPAAEKFVSEVFPPDAEPAEQAEPEKRGRKKKSEIE